MFSFIKKYQVRNSELARFVSGFDPPCDEWRCECDTSRSNTAKSLVFPGPGRRDCFFVSPSGKLAVDPRFNCGLIISPESLRKMLSPWAEVLFSRHPGMETGGHAKAKGSSLWSTRYFTSVTKRPVASTYFPLRMQI